MSVGWVMIYGGENGRLFRYTLQYINDRKKIITSGDVFNGATKIVIPIFIQRTIGLLQVLDRHHINLQL